MASSILQGKRVLITQADAFMGPVLCEVFAEHGASVIANTQSLIDPLAPAAVVTAAGKIDVLVANLAIPAPTTAVTEVSEAEWRDTFASLVDPLPRLFRAVAAADDRTARRENSADGQRVRTARNEAHFNLQRGQGRSTRICAVRRH